ncbi:MAG: 3-hydroxyacyl-ACP dehydratase [Chloroflexi bacterium]|nr:3-hydroxyacyl-ACP dehydratase [Chloroflexota bacterium]
MPQLVKGPLTEQDLVRYSGASGDFNPIHTVPKVAHLVGLDGVIAHGMLIMAYAGQLLTDWAGVGSVKRIKVRFSGMTKPTETLVCRGQVTGTSIEDGQGMVSGKLTVKGQADDSLKLKGDFTLILPLRHNNL